jgi:hypothetical protein
MPDGLREEVEAAVLAEVERIGPTGFHREVVVERFLDRAGRSTLYRWIDAILASGSPGRHLARTVQAAAVKRAARTTEPAADAALELARRLPPVISVDDMAGAGVVGVIEQLSRCIGIADQLIRHAQTTDGNVRNARLLLLASEHLRRSVETSVKLHEAVTAVMKVDRFHGSIIDILRDEKPELAERVALRMQQLCDEAAERGAGVRRSGW